MSADLPPLFGSSKKTQTIEEQKRAIEQEFEKKIKQERRSEKLHGAYKPLKVLLIMLLAVGVLGGGGLFVWQYLGQNGPTIADDPPATLPVQVTNLSLVKNTVPAGEEFVATYDVLARIQNIDPEWGSAELQYRVSLLNAAGEEVGAGTGITFIEPESERGITLFRVGATESASRASMTLETLSLGRLDKSIDVVPSTQRVAHIIEENPTGGERSVVTGTLVNNTSFPIAQAELIVAAFDATGTLVGINGAQEQDLTLGEEREFTVRWRNQLRNVERVEVEVIVNPYDTRALLGQ